MKEKDVIYNIDIELETLAHPEINGIVIARGPLD